MAICTERQSLAVSCNHKALPVAFSFQILEFSDMVDFYLTVRFAAELTLPCGQPFHQTGFSGVLHRVGNVVHSPISQSWLPGEPIVVKQTGLVSPLAVGEAHAKVFANPQLSNRFSHTGAVLGGKGFEHTVLHDVPKRTRSCRVVGNAVIIAESPDFAVILVENFQVIVVLEEVPGFCFPVFLWCGIKKVDSLFSRIS